MSRIRFSVIATGVACAALIGVAPVLAQEAEEPAADQGAEAEAPSAVAPTQQPPRRARPTGFVSWENLNVRMGSTATGLRIDVTTIGDAAIAVVSEDTSVWFTDLRDRIPRHVPEAQARELTPFLVGYTGFEKQVEFDPTRLLIISEGFTFHPEYVIPVTEGFGRYYLDLYETLYAIYLYDGRIDPLANLEFQYGQLSTGAQWQEVVRQMQQALTRLNNEMKSQ